MIDDIISWSNGNTIKRMIGTLLITLCLAGATTVMAIIGYLIVSILLYYMTQAILVTIAIVCLLLYAVHMIIWD